ncbi:DUF72 domain-containing protein [candidate division KSB3 bacterium]|uniref:DUF72 domain-containing protein n=1 Tax=candidate division KSB3 bacterium TaxID=2044937 RepID=A0A9D5Q422_9BACT|nr:DUF72 domain-containing protein [candidate division KSB3 bacterium]MBD3323264.1 DUF72 domain-containing protein [candidate division KSB3 bacterium]
MKQAQAIHIGTSGWTYDHWQGPFYPPEQGKSGRNLLTYYAPHFSTVEVNNSFYQLPAEQTVRHWCKSVPADFLFAVKASRYITHQKKLNDPEESVSRFLQRVRSFGDRLGPILFQLPPRWHVNTDRLHAFLKVLPSDVRYTVEFRDPTWFHDEVYALLREHGVAFCIYDLQGRLSPKEVTTDFVYLRLHGPHEEAYTGSYPPQTLAGWAGAFTTWTQQGKEVFCYFDNDAHGFAPQNAKALQEMISR